MKIGFQGDYRDNWSLSESNFNGRFTFSSLDAYERGRPTTYSVTQGDPLFQLTQFEAGLFNTKRLARVARLHDVVRRAL